MRLSSRKMFLDELHTHTRFYNYHKIIKRRIRHQPRA